MIINHAKGSVQIHSRVECYANPACPMVEITVVRNGLALEPTIEMTHEQVVAFIETLQRLIVRIDEHAGTLDVTQMHPRSEQLLQVVPSRIKGATTIISFVDATDKED